MNLLYILFIKPFELILSFLFSFSYTITQNYLIAIILLSFFVSLCMFPLFYLAELWKRKEQLIQQKMKEKVDIIKKYYSSSKRHYLIAETHKIYGYKSIYAFRTSFGLLIQIPIFCAAYTLLSNYRGFDGVSFFFITDLSKPDTLLFGMPLLPLLMTLINIISSLQYVKTTLVSGLRHNVKEIMQLIAFAFIFLILLYNSPAALVLYWTCNNIFGIVKNALFSNMKSLKQLKTSNLPPIITEKQKSIVLSTFAKKIIHAFFVITSITALFIIFTSLIWLKSHIQESSSRIANISVEIIFCFSSIIVFLYALQKHIFSIQPFSNALKKCLFPIILYIPPLIIGIYIIVSKQIFNFGLPQIILYILLLFSSIGTLLYVYGKEKVNLFLEHFFSGKEKFYFYISMLLVALLFFFYYPSILYTSDPSYFSQSLLYIQLQTAPICIVFITINLLLYYLLPSFLKRVNTFILFITLLCMILYIFVFQGKYGSLDLNLLEDSTYFFSSYAFITDIVCIFFLIAFCTLFYYFSFAKQVSIILSIIFICVFSLTVYNTASAQISSIKTNQLQSQIDTDIAQFYDLSKTDKNVVVFIFDMFTGGHMNEILQRNPHFAEDLTGFVWYPDTLASGNVTILGLAPIYGGNDFTAEAINNRKGKPQEEMNKSYVQLPNLFSQNGYSVQLNTPSDFMGKLFFEKNLSHPKSVFFYDPPIASDFHKEAMKISTDITEYVPFFLTISLFKTIPHFVRSFIYTNSTWLGTSKAVNSYRHVIQQIDLLKMLTEKTSSNSQNPTFKIIYSTLSHIPWHLAEKEMILMPDPYPQTEGQDTTVDGIVPEHFYTEEHIIQLLSEYVQWLKENDVYDNTRIIAVSDHCQADSAMLNAALGTNISGIAERAMKNKYKGRPHALLLFKDFNSNGNLIVSPDLKTSIDAYYLAKQGIFENDTDFPSDNATRYHFVAPSWQIKDYPTQFDYSFNKINGSMFDIENWTK